MHDRAGRTLTAALLAARRQLRPPRRRRAGPPGRGVGLGAGLARPRGLAGAPGAVGGGVLPRRRAGRAVVSSPPRPYPTRPRPAPPPTTRCSSDMDSHTCAHDVVLAVQVRLTKSVEVGCATLAREVDRWCACWATPTCRSSPSCRADDLAHQLLRTYEPHAAPAGAPTGAGPLADGHGGELVRGPGRRHGPRHVLGGRVAARSRCAATSWRRSCSARPAPRFAVVMEPLGPDAAVRKVEASRTADLADTELRRRGGFVSTARHARESEVLARREAELAEGHASFRYSGYVTVSAPSDGGAGRGLRRRAARGGAEPAGAAPPLRRPGLGLHLHAAALSRAALTPRHAALRCSSCPATAIPARPRRAQQAGRGGPRNVVVLLLDSLNRHMLGSYGGTEFETPQPRPLRPRAGRALHVARHRLAALHAGAPRHPVRLARLPLAALGLHRGLGGADHAAAPAGRRDDHAGLGPPAPLRGRAARTTTPTSARWDYVRGHEGDPWRTYADPSFVGTPALPARGGGWFWRDRLGWADAERPALRPLPHVLPRRGGLSRARGPCAPRRGWLRDGAPDDAPFLLFVDEFDPHEPFDTPEPWAGRYDPDWEGELLIWPPYDVGAVAAGPPERARGPPDPGQLRRQAEHDRPLGRPRSSTR